MKKHIDIEDLLRDGVFEKEQPPAEPEFDSKPSTSMDLPADIELCFDEYQMFPMGSNVEEYDYHEVLMKRKIEIPIRKNLMMKPVSP